MATRAFPVLTGVNCAGGEWDWGSTPNPVEGQNYMFVSNQDIDYLAAKGFNFIRLVFSWELLQPTLNGPVLTTGYGATMKARVDYATSKGLYVLIEPHGASFGNFAKYKGNLVGSAAVPNSAFADFWAKVATIYKSNPRVALGLSNEPNNMGTNQWFSAAQAAITGIRSAGSTAIIFVDGNDFSAPQTWNDTWYDTATPKVSNATAWPTLNDPLKNLVVSVHCYFDSGGGGGANDIVSTNIMAQRLQPVVNWARSQGFMVHLSEFGASSATSTSAAAVADACNYIKMNSDVMMGWAWWGYGPPVWWGGYTFTLCPTNNYATDNSKISWLRPFMAPLQNPGDFTGTPVPTPVPTPTPGGSVPTNPVAFTKNTVFALNTPQSNYWVFVPTAYDSSHATPTKMFVWLHGCGGQSQNDVSMVSNVTGQNWISVAVGGREGACWSNMATDGPKILAAIADMKTHFNIDPKQVYLGGYSSGGDIGYPLLFTNAGLFAGGMFENTSPDNSAFTASQTASWKVNIAHLAHLSDTTYPINSTRSNMTTLRNNGFPVTLIEKPGTHYDADSGATGTAYDLRNFLLPFLNAGWVSGASTIPVPIPTPTPTPTPVPPPTAVPNIVLTHTTAKAPGDQGLSVKKIVPVGMDVPAGTYTMSIQTRTTFSDQGSFVASVILTNAHTNVDLSWQEMVVDLRGHVISNIWGAEVLSTNPATGFVTIRPVGGIPMMVLSQGKNGFGFYLTRSTTTAALNYQVLVKSVKW